MGSRIALGHCAFAHLRHCVQQPYTNSSLFYRIISKSDSYMSVVKTGGQLLFVFIFLCWHTGITAQSDFSQWLSKKEGAKIEPYVMLQFWATYTQGQRVFNDSTQTYDPVDDRLNLLLRRTRLGFRAQPYERLKFNLVIAYDQVGRDILSGLTGSANNGSGPSLVIWDAFLRWQVSKNKETAYLTAGYFRPQLSRESITSGWSVNSMEKSMSQNYIRRHLVGTGPGRAVGLNLGGLLLNTEENFGLQYNLGLFNPLYHSLGGNSVGASFSPLFIGRLSFQLGDSEQTRYKIGYDINYYNQRKGLSLSLAGSWQGKTDLFAQSYALNTDLLFNWGPVNLDADWSWMFRESLGESTDLYASNTGHVRLGYNLVLFQRYFLEPTLMLMQFNGALNTEEQALAKEVGAFSGEDYSYDVGLNWYLNKKHLKLLLHYTWRVGDAGEAQPGATLNQFFSQSGVGAVQRGNWWGLGIHAIF